MSNSTDDLINTYLADESLDELKQRFTSWWQQSVETDKQRLKLLRDKLCHKWLKLKDHDNVHVWIALVLFSFTQHIEKYRKI